MVLVDFEGLESVDIRIRVDYVCITVVADIVPRSPGRIRPAYASSPNKAAEPKVEKVNMADGVVGNHMSQSSERSDKGGH